MGRWCCHCPKGLTVVFSLKAPSLPLRLTGTELLKHAGTLPVRCSAGRRWAQRGPGPILLASLCVFEDVTFTLLFFCVAAFCLWQQKHVISRRRQLLQFRRHADGLVGDVMSRWLRPPRRLAQTKLMVLLSLKSRGGEGARDELGSGTPLHLHCSQLWIFISLRMYSVMLLHCECSSVLNL